MSQGNVSSSCVGGIVLIALEVRLPSMFYLQPVVANGGLASYSPDFKEGGRLSATYVRRILEGANPGDLPVEQMHKLVFIINLKTAKQIGLTISEVRLRHFND
jgi:putative tryptophan/tyrosine transport system substrate-binding protein